MMEVFLGAFLEEKERYHSPVIVRGTTIDVYCLRM